MQEKLSITLARIEQKLSDFIGVNEKEHQDLKVSIDELSKHCNHEIEQLTTLVNDVKTKQANYEAIKTDCKEKTSMFQGKLREISILIGFVTIPTGLLITIIINWTKIVTFIH